MKADPRRKIRERANAARRIQPKKQRSGYVLTYTSQGVVTLKRSSNTYRVPAWCADIETPYGIDMPQDTVRKYVQEDTVLFNLGFTIGAGTWACDTDDDATRRDALDGSAGYKVWNDATAMPTDTYMICMSVRPTRSEFWSLKIWTKHFVQLQQ